MGKLIYSAFASLDGFVEDAGGKFDWAAPDAEVHGFANELEHSVGTCLYGRRMYETMVFWETAGRADDDPPVIREFAETWRAAEKVVFSRTLADPEAPRTRVERELTPELVRGLKDGAAADLSVGGAELGGEALALGLVDEIALFLCPVIVGAGKRALPADVRLDLELIDSRTFASGFAFLRYLVT